MIEGKRFDRVSMTWLDPEEYERRYAEWEERVFQKKGNQGELACPMIILDGHKPVQSMTNGKIYDSKSSLRREYKRAGVEEVGNDVPMTKPKPSRDERERAKKERQGAIGRAMSRMGFGA